MAQGEKMLSERVAEQILDMITIDKKFLPGDKLPNENDLSKELGVSRTTLREAVKSLVALNVLEIKRGKGTYVKENKNLTDSRGFDKLNDMILKIRDLFEMRLMFEPQIAYFAAIRATDQELEKILEYGKLTEEKILNNEDRTAADQAFHNAIAKATHNDYVKRLLPILDNSIESGVNATLLKPAILEHTIRDHRILMDFLNQRDAEGAKLAMQMHISHVIKEFDF